MPLMEHIDKHRSLLIASAALSGRIGLIGSEASSSLPVFMCGARAEKGHRGAYQFDELLLDDAHNLGFGQLDAAFISGLETEVERSLVRRVDQTRLVCRGTLARRDVDAAHRDADVAVLVEVAQHLPTRDAPSHVLGKVVDLQLLLVPSKAEGGGEIVMTSIIGHCIHLNQPKSVYNRLFELLRCLTRNFASTSSISP